MRISVVVPCFNHERYVSECLASIDAQDHADLEIIVIDDGSTDASWQKISEFAPTQGHTVRRVQKRNEGAPSALNRGLALATGEVIAICNSDDCFAPGRLTAMTKELVEKRGRFAFSAVAFVDESGAELPVDHAYAMELRERQRAIATHPTVGFALLRSNVAISTGNFVFTRSLLAEIGHFRAYRYCHDWDYLLRALLETEPVYISRELYRYRLHSRNSFRALAASAEIECPDLLRRFMRASLSDQYPNRRAPSRRNWPVYFDYFIDRLGYGPYLLDWDKIDDPTVGSAL
jgi:glycosyltransferase involved in cell wall biosynthesis